MLLYYPPSIECMIMKPGNVTNGEGMLEALTADYTRLSIKESPN